MKKQELYVPSDIDMVELAMEIQNQFTEEDEVHVYYADSWEEFDVSAGDRLGVFTLERLRVEGLIQ